MLRSDGVGPALYPRAANNDRYSLSISTVKKKSIYIKNVKETRKNDNTFRSESIFDVQFL